MIWVVGARGMLGQDVTRQLDALGLPHVESDMECDITDPSALRSFVEGRTFEWIINCSAYTAVDKAEDEEAKADLVNAEGAGNLGKTAAEIGARIVHISTDYVFDGAASSPYKEEDQTSPKGAYGRTKLRGEQLIAQSTPENFIVRTAWLYGIRGNNFVYTMLRLMNEREEVSVVADQFGSPTYTRDLAAALCTFIRRDSRAFGIFHYTNEAETSWFRFASAIYELGRARRRVGHSCTIIPITSDQYPAKAVRPKYSVLSKEKIRRTLGIIIPTWQAGLVRFFDDLDTEAPM
jgi:dTDP-4-dehydrorhamnose reductase